MGQSKNSPRGSEWGKWDLQVQPIKQEWFKHLEGHKDNIVAVTREYLKRGVDQGVRVVAITDHNCGAAVDAALSIIADESLPIAVLPGVEIDAPEGYQLLVIFNPEYKERIQKDTWDDAVQHFLNTVCKLESPVFNEHGCAESIKESIHEVLKQLCLQDIGLPIFAHAQSDKGLFKQTTPANRQKFFANWKSGKYTFALDHKTDANISATKATLRSWGYEPQDFALVKTSDAHSPSELGSSYVWIKAEPTYEGLKQIVYDPASRVSVQASEPVKPTNAIASITFDIPANATLRLKQKEGKDKEEAFCFAGTAATYELSPFFNTFIGGRGSGKSTVLNFLGQHSKDPASSQAFWKRIQPSFDTADRKLFSFNGVEVFEFIGQSEVESFATNKTAFTNAIYERANILSESALQKCDAKLARLLGQLRAFREIVLDVERLTAERELKAKEQRTLEGSIKIAQSEEYLQAVEKIRNKTNDKQHLERWRAAVTELRDTIAGLNRIPDFDAADADVKAQLAVDDADVARLYIEAYMAAHKNIGAAAALLDASNFHGLVQKEEALATEIVNAEKALSLLLQKVGLSEENILQIKNAPQRLVRVGDELDRLQRAIDQKTAELDQYQSILTQAEACKTEYETAIAAAIRPLVKVLDEQAKENDKKDIKNIGLSYFFDVEQAWREIASDVYAEFARQYSEGERADFLRTYILEHRAAFASEHAEIKELLAKEEKTAGYVKFLRDAFSKDSTYQIFATIRDRHLNDVGTYKRIQVLYDGKDIERASFGQKCTAVIVILLLFGNYPLIIDEPEAHLDSSLIANYLVPLIKRKKANRQLIFSTHNANFVVNGDAEKIFILKNETGTTEILEATIEDIARREELLKLEGGREAFRKRGEKLRI